MLLSKLAARPNKSGIAPHVETSDRELRVCAPRDDTAQTGEPARPPPLVQRTENPKVGGGYGEGQHPDYIAK